MFYVVVSWIFLCWFLGFCPLRCTWVGSLCWNKIMLSSVHWRKGVSSFLAANILSPLESSVPWKQISLYFDEKWRQFWMLFVCQTGLLFWFLFLFNFVNVRIYVIEQVPGLKLNKNEQIAMLNLPVVHEGLQRNVCRGKLEGTITC